MANNPPSHLDHEHRCFEPSSMLQPGHIEIGHSGITSTNCSALLITETNIHTLLTVTIYFVQFKMNYKNVVKITSSQTPHYWAQCQADRSALQTQHEMQAMGRGMTQLAVLDGGP